MNRKIIFQTERLTLREADMADALFFLALLNSPGWLAFIGDRGARDEQTAGAYVRDRLMPHYQAHGFGLWVVALRDSNLPIGTCGLLTRPGLEDPDIGFAFLPDYEGQGLAFEAANATMRFARNSLGLGTILAITVPENVRSIQLLQRLGLTDRGPVLLPGSEEKLSLFGIDGETALPAAPTADAQAIMRLVRRFYRSFCNVGGIQAPVDQLIELFIPQGMIIQNTGPEPQIYDLPAFIAPRKALLSGGTLVDFEEHELSSEMQIHPRIAHRISRYEKSGILNGTAFRTRGTKSMQFIRTADGWRFSAVAWEDEAG